MKNHSFLERSPDELALYLVEHARADAAPEQARARTLARTAVAATAGGGVAALHGAAAASVGKAVSATAPVWIAMKWAAIGVASGALTLGIEQAARHSPGTPPREAPVVTMPSAAGSAALPAQHDRPNDGVDDFGELPKAVVAPAPTSTAKPNEGPVEPAPAGSRAPGIEAPSLAPLPSEPLLASELPRELRLLDEARAALRDRAPSRAADALDGYQRDFPRGALQAEAMALRVETYAGLDRHDEARVLGNAFLAKYPASPLAVRVRSLLEGLDRHRYKP